MAIVHSVITNNRSKPQSLAAGIICDDAVSSPIRMEANATGGGGHVQLIQKAMKSVTFRSLCFPDMIKARGLDCKEELPTYFYRDDGYSVWEATKR